MLSEGREPDTLMAARTEPSQSQWLLSLVAAFPGWQALVKIGEGTDEKKGEPCARDS